MSKTSSSEENHKTPSWIERNVAPLYSQAKLWSGRQIIHQIITLGLIVCTALMIWQSLVLVTGSVSPVVVVLSGSMEPTFYKGDILTLSKTNRYDVGDIVVFNIPGREIPIVHRVLEVHEKADGKQEMLTKGDNNDSFDRPLYNGRTWITDDLIQGTVRGFIPYLGHATILLTEFPLVKWVMLSIMGFFVLTAKE